MKKIVAIALAAILLFALAACSKNEAAQPAPALAVDATVAPTATAEPTPEPTAAPTAEPTPAPTDTPAPLSPYNWLGYPEMPRCNYLDRIASQRYYREYTSYIELGSGVYGAESIEATDGANTYERSITGGDGETYKLAGMIYSFNNRNMTYMETDLTSLYAAQPTIAERIAANENATGKVFNGMGRSAVPFYASIDSAAYDYYEYSAGSGALMLIERLYMKDGDVFAVYSLVGDKDSGTAYTIVTTKMTADIPEGIFELPDLSGYTKQ